MGAFDDGAFSTSAFDDDAFSFDTTPTPTPDVGTGFGRRRIASYIKRGGVGTLRGRTT